MAQQGNYAKPVQLQIARPGKYCQYCGSLIDYESVICPKCGVPVASIQMNYIKNQGISEKDWLTALLLCLFLGGLGIHRFYVGKTATGILWLLTLGFFGIGSLVDFILICCGSFTDKDGYYLRNNK